jgi:hypothetical protein
VFGRTALSGIMIPGLREVRTHERSATGCSSKPESADNRPPPDAICPPAHCRRMVGAASPHSGRRLTKKRRDVRAYRVALSLRRQSRGRGRPGLRFLQQVCARHHLRAVEATRRNSPSRRQCEVAYAPKLPDDVLGLPKVGPEPRQCGVLAVASISRRQAAITKRGSALSPHGVRPAASPVGERMHH